MLVWLIAARAPRIIEAIEMHQMICCHWATRSPKGPIMTRMVNAMAATLGAVEKKARTGVGATSATSGVHIDKGTAEVLQASPAARQTITTIGRAARRARECKRDTAGGP